jgi:hypothetical protein
MNSNLIRTLLTSGSAFLSIVPALVGCKAVAGALDCTNSMVPPQYAAALALTLMAISTVIKTVDTGLFTNGFVTLRTMLALASMVVLLLGSVLGCSMTDFGAVDCTKSWLSPVAVGLVSAGLIFINQVLKSIADHGLTKPVTTK